MTQNTLTASREAGRLSFPFTAIVGQDDMKLALLLNAVDPRIGGVLIRGSKGSAKSTAVRACTDILPEVEVVADCPLRSHPSDRSAMSTEVQERLDNGEVLPRTTTPMRLVELPIGATEDRVTGSLDVEHMLSTGRRRFEPGILAAAHRSILYIDEVNLLDDHVVDLLLDSAAMGINTIERDGISYTHPAQFVLVGTMNPEEGDLRPQLLDRFGLSVDVTSVQDPEVRLEILDRRLEFDSDPVGFLAQWSAEQEALRSRLIRARDIIGQVTVSRDMRLKVAELSITLQVEGHRADNSMYRAAAGVAALEGRDRVTLADLQAVAELVYAHRMRRQPFEDISDSRAKLFDTITEVLG